MIHNVKYERIVYQSITGHLITVIMTDLFMYSYSIFQRLHGLP